MAGRGFAIRVRVRERPARRLWIQLETSVQTNSLFQHQSPQCGGKICLSKRRRPHQMLQERWQYMGYNGESVSVSIKYGGFQGDQIAKSWTESGQKIHTIYFPRKENIFFYFLLAIVSLISHVSFEEKKGKPIQGNPFWKISKKMLFDRCFRKQIWN